MEIDVSIFGDYFGLIVWDIVDELEKRGIDKQLIFEALHGEEQSIDTLCLNLIELRVQRDQIPRAGPGHITKRRLAISDTTINCFLIAIMMEGFDQKHDQKFRIPGSLITLIREQLCGANPDLYELYLMRKRREEALALACERLAPNEKITVA